VNDAQGLPTESTAVIVGNTLTGEMSRREQPAQAVAVSSQSGR